MFYREITLFHFHLYTHSSAISKVSLRPVSNEPNINLESFDANREIEYLQLLVSCASLDAGRVLAVTQKVQKLFEMFFMFGQACFCTGQNMQNVFEVFLFNFSEDHELL